MPPRVAFPALPTLPPVPALVDTDRWLQHYDGQRFMRKVKANGHVLVADAPYYVKAALARQHVVLRVDAALRQFVVEANGREIQRLLIKGLGHGTLLFALFVDRLCADTRGAPRPSKVDMHMHAPWHHR